MKQKEIAVLMVELGKHPKVTKLMDDLDSLQKAVSIGADYQGLIEFVSLGNGDCIMCNEEGKLIGLEGNRRLGSDILVGVFYIMSENEDGELLSFTDRKIKHYTNVFWEPETFDCTDIEASTFFRLVRIGSVQPSPAALTRATFKLFESPLHPRKNRAPRVGCSVFWWT